MAGALLIYAAQHCCVGQIGPEAARPTTEVEDGSLGVLTARSDNGHHRS
jgi:hypothetical protein